MHRPVTQLSHLLIKRSHHSLTPSASRYVVSNSPQRWSAAVSRGHSAQATQKNSPDHAFELGVPELQISEPSDIKWTLPKILPKYHKSASVDEVPAGPSEKPTEFLRNALVEVRVGDFVQLGGNEGVTEDGVVIATQSDSYVKVLVQNGHAIRKPINQVRCRIKSVLDPELARSACDQQSALETPEMLVVRAQILREIRPFFRKLADESLDIVMAAERELYSTWKSSDPDRWGLVWLDDAVDHLSSLLPPTKSSLKADMRRWAVHNYLNSNPDFFMCDKTRWDVFHVIPSSHLQNLRDVRLWVRNNDPRIESFVQKARSIIQFSEKLENQSTPAGKKMETIPNPHHEFSSSDQEIIRFLAHSNYRKRATQANPYVSGVVPILRKLGITGESDKAMVVHCLNRLGVLPVWGDATFHDHEYIVLEKDSEAMDKRGEVLAAEVESKTRVGEDGLPLLGDGTDGLRHDWADLPVYIIDDAGALELDDGISIEPSSDGKSHWIRVHIADPTAHVRPDDLLARIAQRRGSTRYLVDKAMPMLPHSLVNPLLSLGGGNDNSPQPVLTASFKVNSKGTVMQYDVKPGFIRNTRILHYGDIDMVLGDKTAFPLQLTLNGVEEQTDAVKPVPDNFLGDIHQLHKLSRKLLAARLKLGDEVPFVAHGMSIAVNPKPLPGVPTNPSVPIHYSGDPNITMTLRVPAPSATFRSREMVAELMTAACGVAGKFILAKSKAGIYRNAVPTGVPTDTSSIHRDPETGQTPWELFQATYYGCYGPTPEDKKRPYIRFTSPLRRYSDMLNHWFLKSSLSSSAPSPSLSPAELKQMCAKLHWNEGNVKKLEEQSLTSLACRHYSQILRQHGPQRDFLRRREAVIMGLPKHNMATNTYEMRLFVHSLAMRGYVEMDVEQAEKWMFREGAKTLVDLVEVIPGMTPKLRFAFSN